MLGTHAQRCGFRLNTFNLVTSTNTLALETTKTSLPHKTWFVADQQSEGYGRNGKKWLSPFGNLYASLALIAPCPDIRIPELGFVAGIALARATKLFLPPKNVYLKWPNDLFVKTGKLAGILIESQLSYGKKTIIVLGIGVNISTAPAVEGRCVSSFASEGASISREDFFSVLSDFFAEEYACFQSETPSLLNERWTQHSLPHGEILRLKLQGKILEGKFQGLDSSCRLQLETETGIIALDSGEILRQAERTA